MKCRTLAPCLFLLLLLQLLTTFTSIDAFNCNGACGCCCNTCGSNGNCQGGCDMNNVDAGTNSCVGFQTCVLASYSTVESNSCLDSWACYQTSFSTIDSNSCLGPYSCYDMNGLTIGTYSCMGHLSCQLSSNSSSIGSFSCGSGSNKTIANTTTSFYYSNLCQNLVSSSIGDNSCNSINNSSYACQRITNSQIGSNSCNSNSSNECQYCSNSNVPDNSCNNLDGGWGPDRNGNYWNSCEYCTNCKNQTTRAQCYVTNITATATTTSSRRLHTNARKGKKSPDGTFDVDCVHLMETIQGFYTTLNVTGTDLAQMIPSQTKAKAVFRKKTGVCEIPLHLIFHHLESEQLTSSCEALERVFTEHTKDFLINFKRFKGLKLSCIAKDINAQVITKKKKKDRKKGGAKDINAQEVTKKEKKDSNKGGGTKRGLSTASLVTHVAHPMEDALKSNGEKIITLDDPKY